MTNLEGRVIRRRRALPPPVGVLRRPADAAAGWPTGSAADSTSRDDPAVVFDELRRASAGGIADYAGITYERIDAEKGVFWPCPERSDHPGTPRLFADALRRPPDGRARFQRVRAPAARREAGRRVPVRADHRPADDAVPERHPDPARLKRAHGRRARTSQLHPDLARRLGIGAGDIVELRTRRGRSAFSAPSSPTPSGPDMLFVPFHWGGASNANALTDPALDPLLARCPSSRSARSA